MSEENQRILIVEDDYLIRWSLREELQSKGYDVSDAETIQTARTCLETGLPDLVLLDEHLPDGEGTQWLEEVNKLPTPPAVVMLTAEDDVKTVVNAVKIGVVEYITKPYEIEHVLSTIQQVLETTANERKIRNARMVMRSDIALGGLIGTSSAMKIIFTQIEKYSLAERMPILIRGDSGTGKEVTARIMHELSPRSNAPFLTLNCSAIPSELAETELFGHEKGSFTSAHQQRRGMFEMADTGTLFLDEVGELPLSLQAKLLRVLEDGTFRRVGGTQELKTDVRVLSATNSPLEERIEQKQFREDLYYRLCGAHIILPPLAQRREDIDLLADHFLILLWERYGKSSFELSTEGRDRLRAYGWPGNVRQLKNCLERAMMLGDTSMDLLLEERSTADIGQAGGITIAASSLTDMEKRTIQKALRENSENQTRAAKALGISRDTLRYRMKKYGIGKTS